MPFPYKNACCPVGKLANPVICPAALIAVAQPKQVQMAVITPFEYTKGKSAAIVDGSSGTARETPTTTPELLMP